MLMLCCVCEHAGHRVLQVTVKDLSWEDKELVLRVLFSKMNGIQGNINRGISNAAHRTQLPMPEPVFVSEGIDMPDIHEAAAYQVNFEMERPISKLQSGRSGGDLNYDEDEDEDDEGEEEMREGYGEGADDGGDDLRDEDIDYDDDAQFNAHFDPLGAETMGSSGDVEMNRLMTLRVNEATGGIMRSKDSDQQQQLMASIEQQDSAALQVGEQSTV